MYKINNWLNCRTLVPAPELRHIYKEFIDYSMKGMSEATPEAIIGHNLSLEKEIAIPSEVKRIYEEIGRNTPLMRAKNLEKALNTNCKIYFKREDVLPTGSFKLNAIIPQAYYAKCENKKQIITETAAGQTGAAAAFGSGYFDLPCKVYMVKSSYNTRPVRRKQMEIYGAEVISSPSSQTEAGRAILEKFKDDSSYPGNEAVAVSECAEDIFNNPTACTLSGSFLDVVLTYQSIIGQEADYQLEHEFNEIRPDKIISCVGGGSSFGGLVLPFIHKYGETAIEYIAVESKDIPKMTKGEYRYDYPGSSKQYPRLKMYTLGHNYTPPNIHSTGLRYHGTSPIISYLLDKNVVKAYALEEEEALKSALLFTEVEGIIPAPESSYGIAKVIEEAKKNDEKVILSIITGNGFLDLDAFYKYHSIEKENQI